MKQIEINGKTYDLHFGLDFIREMDKRYTINRDGQSFGAGIEMAVAHLVAYDVLVIEDIILAATHTLKSIPSAQDIEQWLESQEDVEKVFEDFLSSLQNSPLLKPKIKKIMEEI